jgi:molybdenum cofactor cytidylyltransferase/nicotine blue oxidoreductase
VTLAGLLLAAGAGRRMGRPKALLHDEHDVPFLDRAVGVLLDGGCDTVTVVLGAAAEDARGVLDDAGWCEDPSVDVVVADDWDEGMGASLRAGLRSLDGGPAEAALVTLVDLPDVDESVLRRVVGTGAGTQALVRATYDGRPGHPVLVGRDHWAGVVATAHGDHGARDYLSAHGAVPCECADLATGRDVDSPEDLGRPSAR